MSWYTLTFEAFGVRIGIRANHPDLLEGCHRRLPRNASYCPPKQVQHRFVLQEHRHDDGSRSYRFGARRRPLAESTDWAKMLNEIDWHIRSTLAQQANDLLFVRAGVVGWEGAAIVFPGADYSGKTTLVAELLGHGAAYLSDEFAVFDRNGRVLPYACPLRIQQACQSPSMGSSLLQTNQAWNDALPVGRIVVTSFEPSAKWSPQPLSPHQTLDTLLDNAVVGHGGAEFAKQRLGAVVQQCAALHSPRGEAAEAAEQILRGWHSWTGSQLRGEGAAAS